VFHVKHEGSGPADAEAWGVLPSELDQEQARLLDAYEALLRERAIPRGMIARSDAQRLRDRHIDDSLRAISTLHEGVRSLCDMGSGAGLPGVPLAIVRPGVRVTLAEVRRTRAAFLRSVVRELGLSNVAVHDRRVETFPERVDICTARAFGDPAAAYGSAERILVPGGCLIYWAGASFRASRDLPPGVPYRLSPRSSLARSGPLVIMTRQ
jgi:16S rRNA (guanine527-N7)-methyltransferase